MGGAGVTLVAPPPPIMAEGVEGGEGVEQHRAPDPAAAGAFLHSGWGGGAAPPEGR